MVIKEKLYPFAQRVFQRNLCLIAMNVFHALFLKSKASFHPKNVFIISLDPSLLYRFFLKGEIKLCKLAF